MIDPRKEELRLYLCRQEEQARRKAQAGAAYQARKERERQLILDPPVDKFNFDAFLHPERDPHLSKYDYRRLVHPERDPHFSKPSKPKHIK